MRLITPLLTFITFIIPVSCGSDTRPNTCPEERLVICLRTLAQTHTAFQAGWTADDLHWPQLRRAALEHCGCDSAAFENSLRSLLMSKPEKLEALFLKAMKEEG